MDLTKLSDADLEALQSGDLTKVSDEALMQLQSTAAEPAEAPAGAVAPGEEPGLGTMIAGGLKTAYDVGAPLIKEHPLATTLAASYIPILNKLPILNDIKTTREAAGNIIKRGTNIASNMMSGSPTATAPVGTATNPIGGTNAVASTAARTVPITGTGSPQSVPITTTPSAAATTVPGQASASTPVKGTVRGGAFVPAAAETGMLSRLAPYLQAAGKIAAPAGMAMGAYDAAKYAQEAGLGQRLAQGEGARGMQAFQNLNNQNVSGYMLSPVEAKNVLASGDERTINIYGGRQRLEGIISAPNAVNSGFTNQLNTLSR